MIFLDAFSLDMNETNGMLAYACFAGYKTQQEVYDIVAQLKIDRIEQTRWLKETLAEAKSAEVPYDYKIVCGHYPIYSHGLHGTSKVLIKKLVPLFKEYGVDAYLNGHDHALQVISKKNIVYCAAGSACNEVFENQPRPKPDCFFSIVPGFIKLEVVHHQLRLSIVDLSDKVLKTSIIPNKNSSKNNLPRKVIEQKIESQLSAPSAHTHVDDSVSAKEDEVENGVAEPRKCKESEPVLSSEMHHPTSSK